MLNKRVLVFGGAGSIGSELVRQLVKKYEVYLFDIDETRTFDLYEELKQKGYNVLYRIGDIRNLETVKNSIGGFRPHIIFHAAAYKHVTPMNEYPMEAVQTNIVGTANILECAKIFRVNKLVNISTDKVVHANCIMGATKKVAEIMVKNAGYVSVRFGNVLGSRGSVIPIWQQQIDRGEPLTITHPDMTRYFMTIPDACELVIEALKTGKPGQILILDMGKQIKILDLAKEIIKKSGKNIGIKTIGIRKGETLDEKLMTNEEEKVAIKTKGGKYYVI